MAEHKYGVRTTLLPGWKEFFQKLGEAAVTIHLLQNKPQHTTVVKLNDPASASIKGNTANEKSTAIEKLNMDS